MRLHTITLSVTLALAAAPASACHRYSVWKYPWAQRCPLPYSPALRRAPARAFISFPSAPVAAPAEDKNWYVEIVLTPQVMDEISHGVGIEKIRELNQVRAK
jgi:hypothetical protein